MPWERKAGGYSQKKKKKKKKKKNKKQKKKKTRRNNRGRSWKNRRNTADQNDVQQKGAEVIMDYAEHASSNRMPAPRTIAQHAETRLPGVESRPRPPHRTLNTVEQGDHALSSARISHKRATECLPDWGRFMCHGWACAHHRLSMCRWKKCQVKRQDLCN
jgi:hypothetical protein